ncbi:MAG: hypothetical protein U1E33_03340 [Rhodospirillales bacterium]
MALSQIDLCSRALLKVGARTITSFEEGTAEAEVAASLYPTVRDATLSAHPWNFATAQMNLSKLATPPIADFANAFQIPADCIRVLSAGTSGRSQGITYKIVQRCVFTDVDEVVLTYVARPDERDFPAFFDMALIAQLAAEFCIPLTDSTSRWETLQRLAEAQLRRAKLIDAQEDTPPAVEDFSLLEGRS